jgi:hypothetical protein
VPHHHDEDLYDAALSDPDYLEAVRAHHAGSWDVLDALWWASHPLDPSPAGSLAPLARVRALQRRVFAADADAAGDRGVHEELRRLEAEILREADAIDAAVRAARAGAGAALAGAGTPGAPGDAPDPAAPDPAGTEPAGPGIADDPPTGEPLPDARRRRMLLIGGLTAAVLLGVVVGGQLSAARDPGATPAPAAPASAAATPPPLALAVFQREQTAEDLPAIPLPEVFDPPTLRQLGSLGSGDPDPAAQTVYYAARTRVDTVCLIVVPQTVDYLATCVPEEHFPVTGLQLYWTSEGIFSSSDVDAPAAHTFLTWRPDGSVEAGAGG